MTPAQLATFNAFVAVERREGRPATLREVAAERGINVGVHAIAVTLVEKGFLSRDDCATKGIYTTVNRCPSCSRLMPHATGREEDAGERR